MLSDLVDRQYEAELKMGRVLNIQDRSNVAIRVKSEDSTATWANIAETRQVITMNRQAYAAFLVEDIAEIQANIDLRAEYTGNCGYALTAYIEGDATSGLVSLFNSFTNLVGALSSDPTDDDILRAVQYLDDGDVPQDGRYFYVSPPTHTALLKIDKFTKASYVGQAAAVRAVTQAEVGNLYRAPVYMSSLANNNPSSANTSYSVFGHKRGMALIQQRKPTTHVQYVILETGWGVLVDSIYQFATRLISPSALGGSTSNDRFNVGVRGA